MYKIFYSLASIREFCVCFLIQNGVAYSEPQSQEEEKKLIDWKNISQSSVLFPFLLKNELKNLHQKATDGLMLSAVFRLWAISRPLKDKKT